jgi:hypothetical protein
MNRACHRQAVAQRVSPTGTVEVQHVEFVNEEDDKGIAK